MAGKLTLCRHGESEWNLENRFTGWADVDLTPKGEQEAKDAGLTLKNEGLSFDLAYTSVLKRATRTLWIMLEEMGLTWIPVINAWELNLKLQVNMGKIKSKFGEEATTYLHLL